MTAPLSQLDHALALARAGYKIFPVNPGKKKPRYNGWQQWATSDPAKITAHWNRHPDDNIGIYTGRYADGAILGVDVDEKGKDGGARLRELEQAGNDFPPTYTQSTPTGGRHLLYYVPAAVKQGVDVLARGIDTRSAGGFLVAAGSVTDQGAYATAGIIPPAPAPDWLIARCQRATAAPAPKPARLHVDIDPDAATARAIHYLTAEAEPATAGEGGNARTYATAARAKDLGIADADTCAALMAEHYNPRCAPPWSDNELLTEARNAYRYGVNAPGSAAPEAVFTAVESEEGLAPGGAPAPDSTAFLQKPARKLAMRLHTDNTPNLDQVWLVDELLPDGGLSMMYAKYGQGKSFVAIDIAYAVARGIPWHGLATVRGSVLYVSADGPLRNRMEAYRLHHGLGDKAIPFAAIDGESIDLHNPREQITPLIEAAKELPTLTGEPLRLVVIDTLARVLGAGDENTGQGIGPVLAHCAQLQRVTGAAVLLVHHLGKDESRGARGHTSLPGAVMASLEIKNKVLMVEKQKEGEAGAHYGFNLLTVQIGTDRKGKPITSCVVETTGAGAAQAFSKQRIKPGSVAGNALAVLNDLMLTPDVFGENDTATAVPVETWRERFTATHYKGGRKKTAAMAFIRATAELTKANIIRSEGGHVAIQH